MGLPEININFHAKAVSAIQRSAMGIVALILRDETLVVANSVVTLKSVEDIKEKDWTPANYDYINKTLLGTPSKVVVLRIGLDALFNDELKKLGTIKFNYVSFPTGTTEETETLTSWIKSKRENEKKTYKAVVANQAADDMGVINFTTTGIRVGEKEYTTQEYTARIAGVLAGLPFTRSSTYFVLPEVTEIQEHEDPNGDIDNGELILYNDGAKIKIGRGVNSLTTTTVIQKADYKKIKIVEVMDMAKDDIYSVFEDEYVGKVVNVYDNQVLFITSVNSYYKELAADQILDPSYDNRSFVDVEAQRLAWESIGTDTSELDDAQIREMAFGDDVFLGGNIKIVDAIEDLDFKIFTA